VPSHHFRIASVSRAGWVLAAALLWAATAFPPVRAWAQPSPGGGAVTVQATVGFAGMFRSGAWTPISVSISAASPVEGSLEIAIPRTDLLSQPRSYVHLVRDVSLAAGETRVFWVVAPLRPSPYPLSITVKSRDGAALALIETELRGRAVDGPFFLVLDPSAAGWSFLSTPSGWQSPWAAPPAVAHARSAAQLPPDAASLSGLTAIIVRDTFPLSSLSPQQVEAIATYVRAGGHLILAGGAAPPRIPLAWLSWLPGTTGRVASYDAGGFSVPVWELEAYAPATGEHGGPPLSLSRAAGAGLASIIAFDPSSPALQGDAGGALRAHAAALALASPDPASRIARGDDDLWNLLHLVEVPRGDLRLLAAAAAGYAAAVTGAAWAVRHRPKLQLPLLVLLIAAGAAGAHAYTERSGIRAQVVLAEVQLTRGLLPGLVQNRSYLLAVSTARIPQDLEASSAPPLPFPSAYRADRDLVVAAGPDSIRLQDVPPQVPIRLIHDGHEAIDIRVRPPADESQPLRVENRSGYELRHVHYIERQGLAHLGRVGPGETLEWRRPLERVGSPGWMGLTLQAGLVRLPPERRPDDFDIRLLAAAADRGLAEALLSGDPDRPFIVALLDPEPAITLKPAGLRVERRVLIMPAFPGPEEER